jgi:dTMP kinase
MHSKGKLIVVEGIDGAGKTTHTKLLVDWIQQDLKRNVATFDFPAYTRSPFGQIIGKFLTGAFGDPITVDPFETALLYAGDRLHAKKELCDALDRGDTVVLNRYVPSNLAYGCAKLIILDRANERARLENYTEQLEYELLGLPRPDLVVLLDTSQQTANALIDTKGERQYLTQGQTRDHYEASSALQQIVSNEYRRLARENNWIHIAVCDTEGAPRHIEDIQADIQLRLLGL